MTEHCVHPLLTDLVHPHRPASLDRSERPPAAPIAVVSRATLVPVEPTHAGAVQRLVTSDPAIVEQTRLPDPYPEGGAALWIAYARPRHRRGEEYTFAVESGGAVVGACGLIVSDDRREAELGYWIGRPYRGRGFATDAARAAVAFAFQRTGLDRVLALPLATNAPSRRVLEKAGFWLTGLRPGEARWEGREQAVYETVRAGTPPQV